MKEKSEGRLKIKKKVLKAEVKKKLENKKKLPKIKDKKYKNQSI